MNKLRLEDWLSVIFVCFILLSLVVVGVLALTNKDKPVDTVVIRDPIKHNLMLINQAPPKHWRFKHCTPTNKDCGRLE